MEAINSIFEVEDASKPQYFCVHVRIIEGGQFSGLNADPVRVCVQVGNRKKYTSDVENTVCPVFDKTFRFDFNNKPIAEFLDEIITLKVLHLEKKMFGLKNTETTIGIYKVDLGTVYAELDHQFINKSFELRDPNHIDGRSKGTVKCDIRITCQGDNSITPSIPKLVFKNKDDVDAASSKSDEESKQDKQKIRLIVKIYRADGFPKMARTVTTYVRENLVGESNKDLVNPYVEVSFAGLEGKTTVKRHNYAPVWNEQIIFHEMFPSLCQRIKVQLKERDNDVVSSNVIGTHFIDLKKISNTRNGALPTFGPAFIHLYGSTREWSVFHGFGEGVGYRGRLLIEVETKILEDFDDAPSEVQTTDTCPITDESNDGNPLKPEEFLLFGSIMNATMMEEKLKDKQLFFEISIGNAGNTSRNNDCVHKFNFHRRSYDDSNSEVGIDIAASIESDVWHSTTPTMKPMTHNKGSYFLPYRDEKPCMYIKSSWPDYRLRMYNSNMIKRLAENLQEGLTKVSCKMERNQADTDWELKQVLENFITRCNKYLPIAESRLEVDTSTEFDRERMKTCYEKIKSMAEKAVTLKALVTKHLLEETRDEAQVYLQELKNMIEDPQDALPDIFLWLIVNDKRHAYRRIAAKDLIFSATEEERGKYCSKVHTMFFKLPGNKGAYPCSRWIQARLDIYLWLGLFDDRRHFLDGYPKGYEIPKEMKNIARPDFRPPLKLHYTEKYTFEFRAHMYQARSLIGSDSSGLSDPFARVFIGECSIDTQVMNQTLMPTWDEILFVDDLVLYGSKEYIKKEPPLIVIEIFDKDLTKSDYLGITTALPHVKLVNEADCRVSLEWWNIQRGSKRAGELLATFELIQKELSAEHSRRTKYGNFQPRLRSVSPIPRTIAPTKAMYRIEVLFWGLRNLKCGYWTAVKRPIIEIECAGKILSSSEIQDAQHNPNFSDLVKFLNLELPEEEMYSSPLTIRAVDRRSFRSSTLVGSHIINSVQKYIHDPAISRGKNDDNRVNNKIKTSDQIKEVIIKLDHDVTVDNKTLGKSADAEDADNNNWWARYFASIESDVAQNERHEARNHHNKKKKVVKFKVYLNELEAQPEFNRFQDWLSSFDLYKGKMYEEDFNDESRFAGTFKGSFKVYKLPEDISDFDSQFGFHRDVPSNNHTRVLVRIYIVKANDLHPINSDGNPDPYIFLKLGSQTKESKYIPKELNPVFGECFEIMATFPWDSLLTIQVLDRKLLFPDNIIGETKIDLENRFFSRHRAICGISQKYETTGCNKWRDTMKPTEILTELCENSKLEPPSYEKNSVKIGCTRFEIQNMHTAKANNEQMALAVLHHWNQMGPPTGCTLVPEHIEIRPLYKPGKKNMGRGKLVMWIDMFPTDRSAQFLKPQVNISQRKPNSYELRVIIRNTSNVKLDDEAFITGEKMSDIYVKGWIIDSEEDGQCTDVHYRSLTGEGNFNWRFIFPFDYFAAEKKIVTLKKSSFPYGDKREYKIPARLQLQIFDDDVISADDCLGFLVLNLDRFPKGAKSAELCTLDMLKNDNSIHMINIFEQKRVNGWWPFHMVKGSGKKELTGKVEAELHLLTKEEAEKKPAGFGRNEPNALEKPHRPDWSFLWFLNFTKTIKYIVWRNYKGIIIKIVFLIIIIEFILAVLHHLPNYLVRKLFDLI